jgi:chromate transport protein ChrA
MLGLLATIIGLASYVAYFRDIFANKTKPHVFTWLIWGILTAVAFVAQLVANGGPGAWVNGTSAIICLIVAALGLKYGKKNIKPVDILCLILALVAILWWIFTNDPLFSVILVTIADILGFIPTFRKAYYRPHEETISTYLLSSTKYVISLFALTSFTAITAIFPFYLIFANTIFAIFSQIRRVQLRK